MSFLAERLNRIDASGIRKVFALATKLENPINLSIGQPDYDVDEEVKLVAIDAIKAGFNRYTQTWGIEELREACSDYYKRSFGVGLENVMITCGVSGGLYLALLATVNPGDEVIFADPYFVMYKHLVNLLGGRPVPVDTYPDFRLTAERVSRYITSKTKIILINSPANPTGVTLTTDELRDLAELARKNGLLVISDEIYECLSFDGPRVSMAGMYENTIILNGLSKIAGMTGWRIGYAAGPSEIIQAMNTLQQYTFVCAPSFAQVAAVKALQRDHSPKVLSYRNKRNLIYGGLKSIGYEVVKPQGAFYIFPEAPGCDGDAFVAEAIRNRLLIIPGSVFSEHKSHFRISFAASEEEIKKGLLVLERLFSLWKR
ncbi:MAG TPA: aminotransferase class I/II-fold pyridoxal phosphate-dependent enzyme [Candidatus Hydrogenedentes bacterium]|nr:aminotransferase class I/II-fold pyridoxal phosphate-dependent enzyme [Candidatus Hydrogenedentota bacterium]HOL75755.1 aminotransferase class I/II-fold pyridoxal phosphate-dependent enzyme [Candidatus Hydrogenedentota bacterium]HPO84252.1 aminotransferase class I/II-fold pyridoxal phosphate-dependent enzyme [Candidatus Hydrogenedentota bacterium]